MSDDQPDITPEGQAPLGFDLEAEENQAKENFTLADMFGGPPRPGVLPEKKQLIFRDFAAVDTYNERRAATERLKGLYDAAEKPKRNAAAEVKKAYADMAAEIAKAEALVEEAREKMLASALSFHMRAYPQIALKIVRREAKKLFIDPQTGDYREGYTPEDVQEWMDHRLFGETVQKVVTSTGREVGFGVPKAELGEMFSNAQNMHPTNWQLLKDAFDELTLRAAIRTRAVEDPGF